MLAWLFSSLVCKTSLSPLWRMRSDSNVEARSRSASSAASCWRSCVSSSSLRR